MQDHDFSADQKPVLPGPKPRVLRIGEREMTLKEWSHFEGCEVSLKELYRRVAAGESGSEILKRKSDAGRPRKSGH